MAGGTCLVCDERGPAKKIRDHVVKHFGKGGKDGACLVMVDGGGPYWMYARVAKKAKLKDLDGLLRSAWVECCGHLSSFSDGNTTYLSMKSGFDDSEKTMGASAVKVLGDSGRLVYEYDFGTTTVLEVTLVGMCSGAGMKKPAELAARNSEIKYDCGKCGAKGAAAEICMECLWDGDGDGDGMMCAACAEKHEHGGEEANFLPVVNSPRMGVCGYAG